MAKQKQKKFATIDPNNSDLDNAPADKTSPSPSAPAQTSPPPTSPYAQHSAIDPTGIEQLRQSLMTQAGQLDPNNPNGLSGRMNTPNSKLDMQMQGQEADSISRMFRNEPKKQTKR